MQINSNNFALTGAPPWEFPGRRGAGGGREGGAIPAKLLNSLAKFFFLLGAIDAML